MSQPYLDLHADARTRDLLNDGTPAVLLLGGYAGYANFGDILQLKGAIAWHRAKTDLRPVLMCEAASIPDPGFLERVRRWFAVEAIVFSSQKGLDLRPAGLQLLEESPPIRHLHVYGGGFLNRFWGSCRLDLIDHLHLFFGVGHYVLSGQQVDPAIREELATHFRKCPPLLAGGRDPLSVDVLRECGAPAEYSFDDASEVLGDLILALAPVQTNPRDSLDALIHLNMSFYTHALPDPDLLDVFADRLRTLHTRVADLHANRQPRTAMMEAYSDRRIHEVTDTLGVALQLEDRLPPMTYQVIELGRLALELGAAPLPPLPHIAPDAVALASSYHVTLFCALLGIPCHLMAGNQYYRQKSEGLGLPMEDLASFLKEPRTLLLEPLFEARVPWLKRLEVAYGEPAATPPVLQSPEQPSAGGARSWTPKTGSLELGRVVREIEEGKGWLEGQLAKWQALAAQQEEEIDKLEERIEQLEADMMSPLRWRVRFFRGVAPTLGPLYRFLVMRRGWRWLKPLKHRFIGSL